MSDTKEVKEANAVIDDYNVLKQEIDEIKKYYDRDKRDDKIAVLKSNIEAYITIIENQQSLINEAKTAEFLLKNAIEAKDREIKSLKDIMEYQQTKTIDLEIEILNLKNQLRDFKSEHNYDPNYVFSYQEVDSEYETVYGVSIGDVIRSDKLLSKAYKIMDLTDENCPDPNRKQFRDYLF